MDKQDTLRAIADHISEGLSLHEDRPQDENPDTTIHFLTATLEYVKAIAQRELTR